ncbi:MAG: DUF2156 domain-containing protein [Clostridia bacterium]|nr:DUF2156 domain-containing protein [Clostridia bacterium]
MITTEKITLAQKPQIDAIRAAYGHPSESHSFASLFLWQRDMGLTIHLEEDAYIVRCTSRPGNCWYFPCGNRERGAGWIEELLREEEPLDLIYARDGDIAFLEERFPGVFEFAPADGDSEYLYDRQAYLTMAGEGYRRIRKGVKRLCAEHELRVEPWTAENNSDMEKVLRRWHARFPGEDGLMDWGTSQLMMEHRRTLDLTGVIVYLDGEPASISAGFPLTETSFDIAFSKSTERISGLQDYTRQALARILPEHYAILNGEDDLGIPGIRLVKQLMRPIGQIRMNEARKK